MKYGCLQVETYQDLHILLLVGRDCWRSFSASSCSKKGLCKLFHLAWSLVWLSFENMQGWAFHNIFELSHCLSSCVTYYRSWLSCWTCCSCSGTFLCLRVPNCALHSDETWCWIKGINQFPSSDGYTVVNMHSLHYSNGILLVYVNQEFLSGQSSPFLQSCFPSADTVTWGVSSLCIYLCSTSRISFWLTTRSLSPGWKLCSPGYEAPLQIWYHSQTFWGFIPNLVDFSQFWVNPNLQMDLNVL